MDGTLLNEKQKINKKNFNALLELFKNSNFSLAIATGRPYSEITPTITRLLPKNQNYYVIAANGGHIFEYNQKRFVDIDIKTINNPSMFCNLLAKIALDYGRVAGIREAVIHYSKMFNDKKILKLSCDLIKDVVSFGATICRSYKKTNAFHKLEHFKNEKKINFFIHSKKPPKHNYLELVHYEATKFKAVKRLSKLINIKEQQIFVVGDSINDLEMLQSFQWGFCMKNNSFKKDLLKKVIELNSTNEDAYIEEILEYLNYKF